MRKAGTGLGTPRQRPDGRWEARTRKNGKRISVYGATQKEASDRLREAVAAQRAGVPEVKVTARYTVAACLEEWLAAIRPDAGSGDQGQLKASSFQNYARIVRTQLIPRIGHLRLNQLGWRDLEATNREMVGERKSKATIHGIHSVMHNAMTWAEREGKVASDPTRLVSAKSFGRRQKRHRGLNENELKAVLRVLLQEEEWWQPFFVTALSSGLRCGELCALRWVDLDLESRPDDRGTLDVKHGLRRISKATANELSLDETVLIGTPKTETSIRQVLLTRLAVKTLLRHRGRQKERYIAAMKALGRSWSPKELVFQSHAFTPVNQGEANKNWHRVQSLAGMPYHEQVRLHDTRRTAITMAVGAGDLRAVMPFAGHATPKQSMDYTDPGSQEAIARHMEQLMTEGIEEEAN